VSAYCYGNKTKIKEAPKYNNISMNFRPCSRKQNIAHKIKLRLVKIASKTILNIRKRREKKRIENSKSSKVQ